MGPIGVAESTPVGHPRLDSCMKLFSGCNFTFTRLSNLYMNNRIIFPFVPSVLPQIQIKMPFSIKSGRKLQVIIFDGKNAVISGLHQKLP